VVVWPGLPDSGLPGATFLHTLDACLHPRVYPWDSRTLSDPESGARMRWPRLLTKGLLSRALASDFGSWFTHEDIRPPWVVVAHSLGGTAFYRWALGNVGELPLPTLAFIFDSPRRLSSKHRLVDKKGRPIVWLPGLERGEMHPKPIHQGEVSGIDAHALISLLGDALRIFATKNSKAERGVMLSGEVLMPAHLSNGSKVVQSVVAAGHSGICSDDACVRSVVRTTRQVSA